MVALPRMLFTLSVLTLGSCIVQASVLFNVKTDVEPKVSYR